MTLTLANASKLLDFKGGNEALDNMAQMQLKAAVSLYNMLTGEHRLGYLADEVGTGKTYVALGVVALLRHFNPDLRVLYLLPKNNVREKWLREQQSFIRYNYVAVDLRVKLADNTSAVLAEECRDIKALVSAVATGNARDIFICTSALSQHMGNSAKSLTGSLSCLADALPAVKAECQALRAKIDDNSWPRYKAAVKALWAKSLNRVMPNFDLVIVDEAHNLKSGLQSSDRNKTLAQIMGTAVGDDGPGVLKPKAHRLLLMSATPYDRDIEQLRRQLRLFGKEGVMAAVPGQCQDQPQIVKALKGFMVRRLNYLTIHGRHYSRNMYRDEYRSGDKADIKMGPEQQLVMALLQKKLVELLNGRHGGRYQTGLLASFESFLPKEADLPVTFDEDETAEGQDAVDRNLIRAICDSYFQRFKRRPPHPKMDEVAKRIANEVFADQHKQLVFVRRVASVGELKGKLEEEYDVWLQSYFTTIGAEQESAWLDHFIARERRDTTDIADGDEQSARNDNFFTWFYRGDNQSLKSDQGRHTALKTTPKTFRDAEKVKLLFEPAWPQLLAASLPDDEAWQQWLARQEIERKEIKAAERFRSGQSLYLHWLVEQGSEAERRAARRVLDFFFKGFKPFLPKWQNLTVSELKSSWLSQLAWDPVLGPRFARRWQGLGEALSVDPDDKAQDKLRLLAAHNALLFVLCRSDHPVIDLYLLRELPYENMVESWLELLRGLGEKGRMTRQILEDLDANLELILKLNFPQLPRDSGDSLRERVSSALVPLSPVIGASGANVTSRSIQARRFRMPGYPRVLVSTNVFQEGEDLHTFCDRVTHYGLSASPIALEQKAGRVDRVASKAHRQITNAASEADAQKHFIQVLFPHIKESIEFYQVRQVALNLNAFIDSLHPVAVAAEQGEDVSLVATGPIPAQRRHFLTTPYETDIPETAPGAKLIDGKIANRLEDACKRIHRAEQLLAKMKKKSTELSLKVVNTRGLGELMICAEMVLHDQALHALGDFNACKASYRQRLVDTAKRYSGARLKARKLDDGQWQFALQQSLYAGHEHELADTELADLLTRVTENKRTHISDVKPDLNALIDNVGLFVQAMSGHGDIALEYPEADASLDWVKFHFRRDGRQQKLTLLCEAGYLNIHSQIMAPEQLDALSNKELFQTTVGRNSGHFDLVDFHLNDAGALAVRASHPLGHLQPRELAFLLYQVAAEADRLEALLTGGEDVY